MEKSVPDRLNEFIKYLKISVSEFERNIGVSNGLISKYINGGSKSLGSEKIETIIRLYPNLNTNWLFSGLENMLNENIILEESNKSENDEYHKTYHKQYHNDPQNPDKSNKTENEEGNKEYILEENQDLISVQEHDNNYAKKSQAIDIDFLKREIEFKNKIIETLLQATMIKEEDIEAKVRKAIRKNEDKPLISIVSKVEKEVLKTAKTKEEEKLIADIFVRILTRLSEED